MGAAVLSLNHELQVTQFFDCIVTHSKTSTYPSQTVIQQRKELQKQNVSYARQWEDNYQPLEKKKHFFPHSDAIFVFTDYQELDDPDANVLLSLCQTLGMRPSVYGKARRSNAYSGICGIKGCPKPSSISGHGVKKSEWYHSKETGHDNRIRWTNRLKSFVMDQSKSTASKTVITPGALEGWAEPKTNKESRELHLMLEEHSFKREDFKKIPLKAFDEKSATIRRMRFDFDSAVEFTQKFLDQKMPEGWGMHILET